MMKYVGIKNQIRRNNFNSVLLLIAFPVILLGMVYAFLFFISNRQTTNISTSFFQTIPFVLVGVGIWFIIAWTMHSSMIRTATGARPLLRKENKRVYNLVENLCMSQGMKTPKINVIEDSSLNAFASGLNDKSYTIALSRGIIDKLDDDELEGVIAHELTHIRNRDVRLLIISVIFVGVFAFISEMAFRSLRFSGGSRNRNGKGAGYIILIAVVISAVCYFISILLRFGISRSREYMADAGAAELTKRPYALANALKKISKDPYIEAVQSRDVAQLFIDYPTPSSHKFSWDNLFATHPPITKRVDLLNQFV